MATAIFKKNNKTFHKCIANAGDVIECGLDNTEWYINVEISNADFTAIIDGIKYPVSVNESNEITWAENLNLDQETMGENAFKNERLGLISMCENHLNATKYVNYSRRDAIEAYKNWLKELNLDSITYPITGRLEDWVTAQGGTPVSKVEIA
tara:strand:- start:44 stop:499 length:456 start_codon:yes stop_codon:yes gene_type:complete